MMFCIVFTFIWIFFEQQRITYLFPLVYNVFRKLYIVTLLLLKCYKNISRMLFYYNQQKKSTPKPFFCYLFIIYSYIQIGGFDCSSKKERFFYVYL